MKSNKNIWFVIITFVCLVYILLRLRHLSDSCLWFDEIFSVQAATQPWKNLPGFVAQDLIHPPLFYILLKIWVLTGGESLFWLRLFPFTFAAVAFIPFILFCRQLKLTLPTIGLAAAFFAFNGSLIKYAQEVRMYSLLLCFGLISMWLFLRYLNKGKGLFLLIIFNVLLVYTHYFGWLIVLSEVFAVIILARERFKAIFLMTGITIVSFVPWVFMIRQAAEVNSNVAQNIGWMIKPGFWIICQFIFDLFEPIYFEQSNRDEPVIFLITLPILILGFVAFGFYFANRKSEIKIEKRNFFLLLIFTFVPLLTAFTLSWMLPYSIWGTRHLIIVFVPFVILLSIAFSRIELQKLKNASLTVIFLLICASFLLQITRAENRYIWCVWEDFAANLPLSEDNSGNANANSPTEIYVFEDLVAYHFWFAFHQTGKNVQVIKVNGIEGLTEDKAYFLPRGFNEVKTADDFEGDKFYIAFRAQEWNESAPPLKNLISKSYKIGEPQVIEIQGLKAFLVEVRK